MKSIIAIIIAITSLTANACDMLDTRVCEVFNAVHTQNGSPENVSIAYSSKVGDGRGELHHYVKTDKKIVVIGDSRGMSKSALVFMIAHEYGHAMDKQFSEDDHHGNEFRADEFATKFLLANNVPKIKIAAEEVIGDLYNFGKTHPKGHVRMRKINEVIYASSK